MTKSQTYPEPQDRVRLFIRATDMNLRNEK